MKKTIAAIVILTASLSYAQDAKKAPNEKVFYVYHDKGDLKNHYIPSGWMGDYGDLKLNDASTLNPYDGRTAIEWTYDAKAAQGANWAGVFWQLPANNWGSKPGGYDLSGFKRLTFFARSGKGIIKMATFKVGGITGEFGDSDAVETGPMEIPEQWTKVAIDLSKANLAHIIGAFCWSASRDDNPAGFKLYLDEIRFER